jgi:Glycosyltransferase 61
MSTPILNRQPLQTLASQRIGLAKSVSFSLPCAALYNNIGEFDAAFGLHYERDIYASRRVNINAIDLSKIGDATIYPQADYVVTVGNGIAVEEQMPPWMPAGSPTPEPILATKQFEQVTKETVIIARFGAGTWGHWLGELLPKLVMVEAEFPGRFQYAVPADFLVKFPDNDPWRTFRQSLEAYGMSDDRLLWIRSDRSYRLTNAWAVTPVWSDHQLHPRAAELMRCCIRARTNLDVSKRKVALLRQRTAARSLANWAEIDAVLQKNSFKALDIAALDFVEQVGIFRGADVVFSTLGSGLTGLIYSPDGVRVASVAPSLFGDRFFYALILDRRGTYVDVRGSIIEVNETIPHRSSFTVNPERLQLALEALEV